MFRLSTPVLSLVARRSGLVRPVVYVMCSLAAVLTTHSVAANDANFVEDEIIVRGELRNQTIDTTSLSVSVLDPSDFRQSAVNHLDELLGWVPNVNFSSGASRGRFLQIRGVGERGQFAEPLNPSVGVLLDGVDLSGIGTAATTHDVQQVEVFRGPQGTLYGANALAGIVNVVTNDPEFEFGSSVTADVANFGALGIGAVVTGGLTETLAGRLSVREYTSDGFLDNDFLGVDDTNERDELTVRGKLLYQPNDETSLILTVGLVDIDNGYDAFSLDNDRTTLSDQPGFDRQETKYASLRIKRQLNDELRLDGYLAHANSDIDYAFDEDWTFTGFDPIGYTSFDRYQRDRQTTSMDVRVVADEGRTLFGRDTDWVVGVFGLTQDVDLERNYTFLEEDLFSDYAIDRLAVYGELGVQLAPNLRLAGGLRLERLAVEYDDSNGVEFDPTDTKLGGRLVLEYTTAAENLIYGTLSRGYKTGGANTNGTLPAELREFDSEELWNIELGYKGSFADNRGSVRAAAFVMLRDDVQASTSRIIPNATGNGPGEFIDLIENAAEGINYGLEVEATYVVNEQIQLFASVGLLEAEFDEFINSLGDDLSGRDQAQAPNYQFFAGIEYSPVANWFARLELEGRDAYFFSDSHDERSTAYELLNLSVGYQAENWHAKVWSRNLTDKDTFVRGFQFGNDPRDFYTSREFTQLGEPRRVGLSVGLDF